MTEVYGGDRQQLESFQKFVSADEISNIQETPKEEYMEFALAQAAKKNAELQSGLDYESQRAKKVDNYNKNMQLMLNIKSNLVYVPKLNLQDFRDIHEPIDDDETMVPYSFKYSKAQALHGQRGWKKKEGMGASEQQHMREAMSAQQEKEVEEKVRKLRSEEQDAVRETQTKMAHQIRTQKKAEAALQKQLAGVKLQVDKANLRKELAVAERDIAQMQQTVMKTELVRARMKHPGLVPRTLYVAQNVDARELNKGWSNADVEKMQSRMKAEHEARLAKELAKVRAKMEADFEIEREKAATKAAQAKGEEKQIELANKLKAQREKLKAQRENATAQRKEVLKSLESAKRVITKIKGEGTKTKYITNSYVKEVKDTFKASAQELGVQRQRFVRASQRQSGDSKMASKMRSQMQGEYTQQLAEQQRAIEALKIEYEQKIATAETAAKEEERTRLQKEMQEQGAGSKAQADELLQKMKEMEVVQRRKEEENAKTLKKVKADHQKR
jgi:hypothetical protein